MCIWQGFYAAACAFERNDDALATALSGMEKLLCLGGDARLSRGADGIDGQHATDPSRTYYTEDGYVFTDECSESSLIGFLFGLWAVRANYPVDHAFRLRADGMAASVYSQLKADGMRLLNKDGSAAQFGDLRPRLTTAPIRISAGACAALLCDAAYFTGRAASSGDYARIWRDHRGALTHPETHIAFVHPWYQDVIAYAVLLMQVDLAPAACLPQLLAAMRVMWEKTYKEDNPLYLAMATWAGIVPDARDVVRCRRTLEECNVGAPSFVPSPKMAGSVVVPRADEFAVSGVDTFTWGVWKWRTRRARSQVPVWRRPPADFLWQRCPYGLDGSADSAGNWMDYLLAYSMGARASLWR
jgi:hypothetical protein